MPTGGEPFDYDALAEILDTKNHAITVELNGIIEKQEETNNLLREILEALKM